MEHPEKKARRDKVKRHPPHLKGKQIGLYYAKLSKERKNSKGGTSKKDFFLKCVGSIVLTDTKKSNIVKLLKTFDTNNVLYNDSIKESLFKKNFVDTISKDVFATIEDRGLQRDSNLDCKLYEEHCNKLNNRRYQEMLNVRQKLPAYNLKDDIVGRINRNQVIVITGETGCGKTTQVAQFILDDYLMNKDGSLCNVCCTQPRRISAFSVAARVAEERAEKLGESVGYQIRLESVVGRKRGSIVYCTTGVLIKQLESDPSLNHISHLIMDEIHERDSVTDFLITYIKKILSKRKNLKVILMSATLNSDKFAKYFNNCEMMHIPGYTYPVQEYYLEDVLAKLPFTFETRFKKNEDNFKHVNFITPYIAELKKKKSYHKSLFKELLKPASEELNLNLIMDVISYICSNSETRETILVFLTGYSEISKLFNMMRERKFRDRHYIIYPLHSRMASTDQRLIFDKPPQGMRKIILSTNIAETSITIDDVVYVIDCGKIKMTHLHIDTNNESLDVEWVSLANAHQRRGRAGRIQPGICYHLFTKHRLKYLEKYQKPEILRKRLESTILTIKILSLGDAKTFLNLFMDCPCEKAIDNAINLLKRLNALDDNENLTPLGYHLAKLPLDPQLGKMLLLAASFGCLDPVLTIATALDYKDPFYSPLGKEKLVDRKKYAFSNGWKSDHLLMIQVMKQYERCSSNEVKKFCYDNFLSYQTMELLRKMKKQFADYLYQMKFICDSDVNARNSNYNSGNLSLVKAVVCAGLYPNVALKSCNRQRKYPVNTLKTIDSETIYLHPQSVLTQYPHLESNLVVYYNRLKCGRDYVFDGSMVHPLPLVFFGDQFNIVQENKREVFISINGRIKFKCHKKDAIIIQELREKLNLFLKYKVSHPGHVNWDEINDERNILKSIVDLITIEDLDLEDVYDSFDDSSDSD